METQKMKQPHYSIRFAHAGMRETYGKDSLRMGAGLRTKGEKS